MPAGCCCCCTHLAAAGGAAGLSTAPANRCWARSGLGLQKRVDPHSASFALTCPGDRPTPPLCQSEGEKAPGTSAIHWRARPPRHAPWHTAQQASRQKVVVHAGKTEDRDAPRMSHLLASSRADALAAPLPLSVAPVMSSVRGPVRQSPMSNTTASLQWMGCSKALHRTAARCEVSAACLVGAIAAVRAATHAAPLA